MANKPTLDILDERKVLNEEKKIIIDVGLTYTKCGFVKDPTPSHIIPTEIPLLQKLRDQMTDVSFCLLNFGHSTTTSRSRMFSMMKHSFTWRSKSS